MESNPQRPGISGSSQAPVRDDNSVDVPVLIAGAGPVGLVLSLLLSRQGIANLIVEKRGQINNLPRARGITVRSLEILSQLGLREALQDISLPPLWTDYFVYTGTVAGDLIGKMPTDAMKAGAGEPHSICDYLVAAQDRIDPLLFDAVTRRGGEVRFNSEVVAFEETDDAVTTTIRRPDGSTSTIRSRYLVAADGGSSPLRKLAGIGETGRANLRSYINNHVRADLSRFTAGREGALIWTLAPGLEGLFQMLDGDRMWAIQVQYDPATFDPAIWTNDYAVAHLKKMIGGPDADQAEIEILKSYTFTLSMTTSDRMNKGRLLMTGDAAHTILPYGGFGLNTGIQTAHNLAWKLAAVLRGEAPPALFDSYDAERREVARRVSEFGRTNAGYVEQLMTAVRNAESVEEKGALVRASRQYGNWWGLDLGVHYEGAGAFVPDDIDPPQVDNPVTDYVSHAKPGYRAPHFWALRDGERVDALSLFDGRFTLLAGPEGEAWVEAARRSDAALNPKVHAYRVAPDGDLAPELDFSALYGIGPAGAVLVRPDGHVAYRAQSTPADPLATLRQVLDTILSRDTADAGISADTAMAG
ncbi:MAG: 2-polyprenyl-6-methoxyphenol hydroxylase [Bradyrhizobium sp.]|nr:2-polyprenyl-6-methoxyphenol hydroxylase [Bradyrhizobium sp.]